MIWGIFSSLLATCVSSSVSCLCLSSARFSAELFAAFFVCPSLHSLKSASPGRQLPFLWRSVVGSPVLWLIGSVFPVFWKSGCCLPVSNILAFSLFSLTPQRSPEGFPEPISRFPQDCGVLTTGPGAQPQEPGPLLSSSPSWTLSPSYPTLFFSCADHFPSWRYGAESRSRRIQLYLSCVILSSQGYLCPIFLRVPSFILILQKIESFCFALL